MRNFLFGFLFSSLLFIFSILLLPRESATVLDVFVRFVYSWFGVNKGLLG